MIVFLHNDLDAIGCEMCIEEMPFNVSKIFYTNYSDFTEKCNQILEYAKTKVDSDFEWGKLAARNYIAHHAEIEKMKEQ